MKSDDEGLLPQKTSPLRAVYAAVNASSKITADTLVIMNPDAMEFCAVETSAVDDAEFEEAIEEAQELIEAALRDDRALTQTEEKRLAQLFSIGVDCQDMGISGDELERLRKRLE